LRRFKDSTTLVMLVVLEVIRFELSLPRENEWLIPALDKVSLSAKLEIRLGPGEKRRGTLAGVGDRTEGAMVMCCG
jgi:hypothetical protein